LQPCADNGAKKLPHITWCATGHLALLPLHAAGIYDADDPSADGSKAPDIVVSSYTPSLSALIAAETRHASPARPLSHATPQILVVSQPDTPGLSQLPCTVTEAEMVSLHFPNSVKHLSRKHATVNAVLDAMNTHEWVHLACHGIQDTNGKPTESAFFLHDGRLQLSQLMGKAVRDAELAVLSACQTAKGDGSLPEEAVHLAAGMLAVGYKSVVATMWSIDDADGPVLSDALYVALKRNHGERVKSGEGLKVAYALHEAVGRLRKDVQEKNFARWVPFVHFGV
jgi:CHAT domain-containing protein